ncbi:MULTISPECIES: HAAS signaling domain-containing protein [unclassified Streptomyces]|uniref:HAAS signaling domain-containing protein n=1 Tax=unclassified Streptomyces TaxID=2593676 RepID=UPI0037FEF398
MTGTAHPLVTDYLDTIEREASFLTPGRREELLADLREHLAVAVGDEEDPQAVRTALERLGSPSAIVAAARAEEPESPVASGSATTATATVPNRTRDTLTAVLIGVTGIAGVAGSAPSVLALIVSLFLLWTSDSWDRGTKALASALTVAPPVVVLISAFLLSGFGVWELLTVLAVGVTLPVVAAVLLFRTRPKAA